MTSGALPETPQEALKTIAGAALAEARRDAQTESDPLVSVAFSLGWQMAEIYRPEADGLVRLASDDHLPGLSGLTADQWSEIGLMQMQAGITKLQKPIQAAKLTVPDAEQFANELDGLTGEARDRAVTRFHVALLGTLTAADYRLGKGYGVGRALADLTRGPADWRAGLSADQSAGPVAWIRDLATAFPPHAAHPVAQSLAAWSKWAELPPSSPAADATARAQLQAQGRLWRSLLSGEKRGQDMLEARDYIRAGEQTLQDTEKLVQPVLAHHWPLVAAVVLLFCLGVLIAIVTDDAGGIVSGLGVILASIGVGWKGLGTALGRTFSHLETPVWEAAIDLSICRRITPERVLADVSLEAGPDEPSLVAAAKTLQPAEAPTAPVPPVPAPGTSPPGGGPPTEEPPTEPH